MVKPTERDWREAREIIDRWVYRYAKLRDEIAHALAAARVDSDVVRSAAATDRGPIGDAARAALSPASEHLRGSKVLERFATAPLRERGGATSASGSHIESSPAGGSPTLAAEVEGLLPCRTTFICSSWAKDASGHFPSCPAHYRPAVLAALRDAHRAGMREGARRAVGAANTVVNRFVLRQSKDLLVADMVSEIREAIRALDLDALVEGEK